MDKAERVKDKRVTIMIAQDIDKKIRKIQAAKIQELQTSYSFSRVMDDLLRKALKGKGVSPAVMFCFGAACEQMLLL